MACMVSRMLCRRAGLVNKWYTASSTGKVLVTSIAMPLCHQKFDIALFVPRNGITRIIGRFLASASETVRTAGLGDDAVGCAHHHFDIIDKAIGQHGACPVIGFERAGQFAVLPLVISAYDEKLEVNSDGRKALNGFLLLEYPMLPPIMRMVGRFGSMPSAAHASSRGMVWLNFGWMGMPKCRTRRLASMPRLSERWWSSSLCGDDIFDIGHILPIWVDGVVG